MMMYGITMQNDLPQTWTLGVFQTYPNTSGIDSVAWKQVVIPSKEPGSVSWQCSNNVCIANYSQINEIGVYSSDQIMPAQSGSIWKVVLQNGHQQLEQDTSTPPEPNQITIRNESGQIANPGIGMSGIATAYMKGLYSGVDVIFKLPSTYWVALFRQLATGDVIADIASTTPLLISFPNGIYTTHVHAYLDGGSVLMSVQYTQTITDSVDALAALEANAQPDNKQVLPQAVLGPGASANFPANTEVKITNNNAQPGAFTITNSGHVTPYVIAANTSMNILVQEAFTITNTGTVDLSVV